MIATGDGKLLLCNHSDEQGGVFVSGENGKHITTVKLQNPYDIAFISQRTVEPVVVLIESSKTFHFPLAFQLFLLMLKLMALYLYYL
jgi:hypothetical protein